MKATQYYRLLLNDMEIGILQEVEETLEREIKQQRAYRKNDVQLLQCGAESFTLHLQRLAVPFGLPSDLHSLHNFSLTLVCEERSICYTGCEFSRLHTKTDSAGMMVEEASIFASERSVTAQ